MRLEHVTFSYNSIRKTLQQKIIGPLKAAPYFLLQPQKNGERKRSIVGRFYFASNITYMERWGLSTSTGRWVPVTSDAFSFP